MCAVICLLTLPSLLPHPTPLPCHLPAWEEETMPPPWGLRAPFPHYPCPDTPSHPIVLGILPTLQRGPFRGPFSPPTTHILFLGGGTGSGPAGRRLPCVTEEGPALPLWLPLPLHAHLTPPLLLEVYYTLLYIHTTTLFYDLCLTFALDLLVQPVIFLLPHSAHLGLPFPICPCHGGTSTLLALPPLPVCPQH